MFDRKDFEDKLVNSGKMNWLTAYWFANCREYINKLEERVKLLEDNNQNYKE